MSDPRLCLVVSQKLRIVTLTIHVRAEAEHLDSVKCPCKQAPCVFDAREGVRPKFGLGLGPSARNRAFLAAAWRLIDSTFQYENIGLDTAFFDDLHSFGRPLLTQEPEERQSLLPPLAGTGRKCQCTSRQHHASAWLPDDLMHALEDGVRGFIARQLRLLFTDSYTEQLSPDCNCLTTCCIECWYFIFVMSRLGTCLLQVGQLTGNVLSSEPLLRPGCPCL